MESKQQMIPVYQERLDALHVIREAANSFANAYSKAGPNDTCSLPILVEKYNVLASALDEGNYLEDELYHQPKDGDSWGWRQYIDSLEREAESLAEELNNKIFEAQEKHSELVDIVESLANVLEKHHGDGFRAL